VSVEKKGISFDRMDRTYGGALPFAPNPAFPNSPAFNISEEERCLMHRHAALGQLFIPLLLLISFNIRFYPAHRLGITRKIDIWEEEEITFGTSDLWQASREGNLDRIKFILEHGVSVNSERCCFLSVRTAGF